MSACVCIVSQLFITFEEGTGGVDERYGVNEGTVSLKEIEK